MATGSVEVYDGAGYIQIPGTPGPQTYASVGPVAPSNPEVGQIWVPDDKYLIDEWDDDWQYPTLLNGWVDYNPTTYGNVRYRKAPGNLVLVEGMVKSGTVNVASPVFILPVGYRTARTANIPGTNVNENDCRIIVCSSSAPAGGFSIHQGDPYWVSIHCCFVADA